MEVNSWIIFFGRFHPLVVHLPIGFLLMAFIFKVLTVYKPALRLEGAVQVTLLLGGISAAIASLLGYLLSLDGGYDSNLLDRHMWSGIITTMLAFMAYALIIDKIKLPDVKLERPRWAMLIVMTVGIMITGHLGGSLTHGEDYLTAYLPFNTNLDEQIPLPNSLDEVQVYSHLVKPILDKKCKTCHRRGKRKGELSFETMETFRKGGENGVVFVPGNSSESEMVRRTHLDPDDDDFMPSEGKKPLTEKEKEIIVWWIDHAQASFDTLYTKTPHDEKMDAVVSSILGLGSLDNLVKLPAIDSTLLNELMTNGFVIRELVGGTNMLDVTLPPSKAEGAELDQLLKGLEKIGDNVVWLNLSGVGLLDNHLLIVGTLTNLQKLRIDKNPITDKGILALRNLEKLTSINLYSTRVTDETLEVLKDMKNLRNVYTFNTKVTRTL